MKKRFKPLIILLITSDSASNLSHVYMCCRCNAEACDAVPIYTFGKFNCVDFPKNVQKNLLLKANVGKQEAATASESLPGISKVFEQD